MTDSPSFRRLPPELNALQKHVAYFDATGDGTLTRDGTKVRLQALGISSFWSGVLSRVIHGFLSRLAGDPQTGTIAIARIVDGKHPFDTGVYDAKGNVDRAAFDLLFAPEGTPPGARTYAVTRREIRRVIKGRGDRDRRFGTPGAVFGYLFSGIEIWLFLKVASDCEKKDGLFYCPAITRRRLARFYEGRLFFDLERRHRLLSRGISLPKGAVQRFDAAGIPYPRNR